MRNILLGLLASVFVVSAAFLGLSLALGAHPFWTTSIAVIGAPVGAVLGIVLRYGSWSGALPALVGGVLTAVAYGTAHLGKTRFAASFAEDAVAGQMWYFGWIATAAFAALTLTLLPRR